MDKTKTKLEFLKRVTDDVSGTLNAASAILRVEMLVDDAERAAELFKAAPPKDPFGGWRPFSIDIVSYYSVGYVTCLEWHARSKLTDLFTYMPGGITEEDIKKAASGKILTQLIGANASIPHFLAATQNYSSADAYLNTFDRIFRSLKIEPDPWKVVHNVRPPDTTDIDSGLEYLSSLYAYRNMLVHEISNGTIGHPVSHAPWTSELAVGYGRFIYHLIRAIEFVITEKAPTDFPNKLSFDGRAIEVEEHLKSEIFAIEAELSEHIKGFEPALEASRAAIAAEEEMLLHYGPDARWLDLKAPARRALRRGRIHYLKTLREALE